MSHSVSKYSARALAEAYAEYIYAKRQTLPITAGIRAQRLLELQRNTNLNLAPVNELKDAIAEGQRLEPIPPEEFHG